jgi:2-C-methyl-D-erythritol 4-phosphate cytidylyltransferase
VVPADTEACEELARRYGVEVVTGGATRQSSVARGLQRVTADHVVVHDAARPIVTPGDIARVVAALEDADAAISAVPVDETLKRVRDERVLETVDRAGLWRAQTPQAFRTETLRAAHRRAAEEGLTATDDALLIERYGKIVAVVQGSRRNLKVTWEEDFAVAEAMMRA